ncbi:hypothetical protein OOK41_13490 [Micromonospora sp. NBC_01655]|uniref:hypothetical protein n=1 Tax=Micromonospora sp. NBC_01655 TaxID=2975983 RepID=UPI0022576E56|nr:hypothetical protein [Micromonospora sp. NBC_01655]MCX4471315.1 hypothetical protein [Micromonospora sp. NBC_01655]
METWQMQIAEYDTDGNEVYRGYERIVPLHSEATALQAAAEEAGDWTAEHPDTETWRIRVLASDGGQGEAWGGIGGNVRSVEPTPPPDRKALVAQLDPLTTRLRAIAEPLALAEDLPALDRLLPQAARLLAAVQHALGTTGDPHGMGRANLKSVLTSTEGLTATAMQALADEQGRQ